MSKQTTVISLVISLLLLLSTTAYAAITVTPSTWNVIGLDSNSPGFGPYRFPVGAQVCSDTTRTNVQVDFTWDTGGTDNGTYINLRTGTNNPIFIDIPAGGCTDAFFEVELNRTSSAFDQTRRFHITAGGVSTPTPREIKVERLVSQSRNAITNMEFGTSLASLTSVPNGGSMDLIVGNTYYIRMSGYTATQGYQQLESFVNFPNTIFQILSVETTYSADTSPIVNSPSDKLYADSCGWDNDPNSPSYLSCWVDGKAGGTVTVTYEVEILSTGTGRETLNSLIHDFSGSSFHYNADFSSSARFANLIDPTAVTISKNFTPDPVGSNGISTLTFVLTNPNGGSVSDLNFTDTFPTSPAAMTVASPLATTNSCGGSLLDDTSNTLGSGDAGVSLSGGSIPAFSSCSIKVNVTAPAEGTYNNNSGNLFVGTIDTGDSATDTLTIDDNAIPPPPPPPNNCATPVEIARWNMASTTVTSKASDVASATASSVGGAFAIDATQGNPASSWAGSGWSAGNPATATPFYLFSLDTSMYGGVSINLDYYMSPGGWAKPSDNYLIIDTQADSGGYSNILSANVAKGSWTTIPTTGGYKATTTGTGITDFKIRAYGAKTGENLYIDNVVFTGCTAAKPPTISKVFSPDPVAVNGSSTLTFTVTNPNTDRSLSGIAFTDTLPADLTVTNGSSAVCGGTLTRTAPNQISFAGGSLAVSSSCSITATVTATSAGTHDNVTGFVTATESGANTGAGGSASAQLVALPPPVISKTFAANPVYVNDTSRLSFTITNPSTDVALSGVAFTDTYPAGLVNQTPANATTSCASGTLTAVAGGGSITLSGETLPAGGSCTISVDVTSATAGTYVNTSGPVSHILNGIWNGNTATDTLLVETPNPAVALLKQVSTSSTGPWSSYLAVATGDDVYYQFTVENLGDVPLSSVDVTDPEPTLDMTSCIWNDGDGLLLTAPFNLPVADADNGHLATCTLGPITAATGSHPNTATASATFAATTVTDTSTATYATSALTLTKSAAEAYFLAVDDVLNYGYTISNTGAAILAGPLTITVSDNKISSVTCPALTTVGNNNIDFDPGESLVCSASYTVTASDVSNKQVTNIARAKVGVVFTPIATATVPLGPDLSVIKSNSVGGAAATSTPFTWTLTASNASSAGAPAIFSDGQTLLTDDLPAAGATYIAPAVATNAGGTSGVISCSIAANSLNCTATGAVSIPPGGSFIVPVTTTPTVAGVLVNPRGGGICQVDPASILIETDDSNNDCADTVTASTPAITLIKTADVPYFLAAGDSINYSYAVSNTGAVLQPGPVTVADDKTAVVCPAVTTAVLTVDGSPGNNDGNLDPGEQITCTSAYTVLAADVTAKQVTNIATATVGIATTPQVSLTVPIGPDLGVVKTHPATTPNPGTPFDWTLTVTNEASAGYAANFDGTVTAQTLLIDDLPAGLTYSVPATATNTGGTTGAIDCSVVSDTLTCSTSGVVSIPPGGGFTIAVSTTSALGGTLTNPRSGGICRVDPTGTVPGPGNGLVLETIENNNDCSDSVLVGKPSLLVLKSADKTSAVPGALINYSVTISNSGPVIAKNVKIEDFLGRYTALAIDPYGNGTAFNFNAGTSGLNIQTIEYSDDTDDSDGISYGYTPSDPSGFDSNVTNWRITMGSDMNAAPSQFTLQYQVKVK